MGGKQTEAKQTELSSDVIFTAKVAESWEQLYFTLQERRHPLQGADGHFHNIIIVAEAERVDVEHVLSPFS